MSSGAFDMSDLERRMEGAANVLRGELSGLRTGRASASLLDPITVMAYGAPTPLNQVASVTIPEPRMISVQVWDKDVAKAVERAIRESDLGLNPIVEGQVLRLPLPELNEERRVELVKVAHKYAENARISVRNVRRDGMDKLKHLEKDSDIGEDEMHTQSAKVQTLTDKIISEIDAVLAEKEIEIMQV